MILPDVNLLLYAIDRTSPQHSPARRWLEDKLSGREAFAFAWAVLLAFVRLTTRAAVFERPVTIGQALDLIDGWLAQPCATVVHPTNRHPVLLRELLERSGVGGNLVADAHLAALAIEHGATLASRDADFARVPRLRWVDPLASS